MHPRPRSQSTKSGNVSCKHIFELQMAELERQAEHMVEVESRAEVAEGERDAALDKMALMTPRPALSPTIDLPKSLGLEGTAKFLAAINKHRYPEHSFSAAC